MSFKKVSKFVAVVMPVLLCISCSMFFKKEERKYNIDFPSELQLVNKLILERKTDDAKNQIDDYLNRSENIHWFGHAYFLKGFLYEMDENYEASIGEYRSAIQHSSKYNSRVEAKALYNLSYVYERVGNMEKLTTTLLDIMKRREFFDVLTGQVETPARLAATYAYMGKMKESYIFHREASENFNQMVRHKSFKASKSEISKSLYYLGLAVYNNGKDDFNSLMEKIKPGQKYFLASAEASKSEWAKKSTNQLLANYSNAWKLVESFEPKGYENDPLAHKKQKHSAQLEMASDMYDLLHKLKVEEFPMMNVNKQSKAILNKVDKWIRKIEKFALHLDLGPEQIRNKKVKQRKLMRYIEKPKEPVRINKETVSPKTQMEDPNL